MEYSLLQYRLVRSNPRITGVIYRTEAAEPSWKRTSRTSRRADGRSSDSRERRRGACTGKRRSPHRERPSPGEALARDHFRAIYDGRSGTHVERARVRQRRRRTSGSGSDTERAATWVPPLRGRSAAQGPRPLLTTRSSCLGSVRLSNPPPPPTGLGSYWWGVSVGRSFRNANPMLLVGRPISLRARP